MYSSFDKESKTLGLWKSKYYMPNYNVEPLNKNLAEDYRQFWMYDIHKSDYLMKTLVEPLRDIIAISNPNIAQTLRIVDSYTNVMHRPEYRHLKWYNIKVLFTFDGDPRPINEIIETCRNAEYVNKMRDGREFDGKHKMFNCEAVMNGNQVVFTENEYVATISVPFITDNCTYTFDTNADADNNDCKERHFKLKLEQKPGIYLNIKKVGINLDIFKQGAKASISETDNDVIYEDKSITIDGGRARYNAIGIARLLFNKSVHNDKSINNFARIIETLGMYKLDAKVLSIDSIISNMNNSAIDMINTVLHNFERDLDKLDSLQYLMSKECLVGRTLSRDCGLPAGTLITEANKNSVVPIDGVVYVKTKMEKSNITFRIREDIKIPFKVFAKYINGFTSKFQTKDSFMIFKVADTVSTEDRINMRCKGKIGINGYYIGSKEIMSHKLYHGYNYIEYKTEGSDIIVKSGSIITSELFDMLSDIGYSEIGCLATKDGSNSDEMKGSVVKLRLDIPVFITILDARHSFEAFLTCLVNYRCITCNDKPALYHLMNIDSSFNKKIVTPKETIMRQTAAVIARGYKSNARNIRGFLDKNAQQPIIMFRDKIETDNTCPFGALEQTDLPISVVYNTEFAEVRKNLVSKDLIDTVTQQAMINPIHYVYSLREVSSTVKDANSIAFNQRQLHVSMLGRLDIFEVPMSKKLGITTSLASGCEIGTNGELQVEYKKVINGYVSENRIRLEAIQEHPYCIVSMTDIDIDDDGKILNLEKPVLAKVPAKDNVYESEIRYVFLNEIANAGIEILVAATPYSEVSWSISAIPFIGNNDSARVTYGVSQIKQAKILIDPEKPFVQTPAWKIIPKLQLPFNTLNEITENSFVAPSVEQSQYSLNTVYHKGLYNRDENAYKNAECNCIKDGVLALGRNALVVFIPDGYNYEDAVHVSYNFASKLASYRMDHKATKKIYMKKKVSSRGTESITSKKDVVVSPVNTEIHNEIKVLKKDDVIVSTKLLGMVHKHVYNYDYPGYMLDWHIEDGMAVGRNCVQIKYNLLKVSTLMSGDKLSNRHGNKGVLSYPDATKHIPGYDGAPTFTKRLPILNNGKQADIVYNPLGVIARMNLGQIYEAQLGLVCKVLGIYIEVNAISDINQDIIRDLVSKTSILTNTPIDSFDSKVDSLFGFNQDLAIHIKSQKAWITSWANTFDEKGMAEVTDPEIGKIRKKVMIGYIYINKLIQESESKVAGRGSLLSGSEYVAINGQPTKGTKKTGGQREGNMELDALMAYGADSFVRSALNGRCNNITARNMIYNRELGLGQVNSKFYIRRSSQYFISAMKALGVEVKSDSYNDITKMQNMFIDKEISERFTYGKKEELATEKQKEQYVAPEKKVKDLNNRMVEAGYSKAVLSSMSVCGKHSGTEYFDMIKTVYANGLISEDPVDCFVRTINDIVEVAKIEAAYSKYESMKTQEVQDVQISDPTINGKLDAEFDMDDIVF